MPKSEVPNFSVRELASVFTARKCEDMTVRAEVFSPLSPVPGDVIHVIHVHRPWVGSALSVPVTGATSSFHRG